MDFQITRFWHMAEELLFQMPLPAKMWQLILGHLDSLEWFVPGGEPRCVPFCGN